MRIIAGSLKSRIFKSPSGQRTHPMSEKVRGALFQMLGDIEDLNLLDAYSGSGAIAFEAYSRGANFVQALEIDKRAYKVLKDNVQMLGLTSDQTKITRANCTSWTANNPNEYFDIIVADPPYDQVNEQSLAKLAKNLSEGGIFVLSYPGNMKTPTIEKLELIQSHNYGDAALAFYR